MSAEAIFDGGGAKFSAQSYGEELKRTRVNEALSYNICPSYSTLKFPSPFGFRPLIIIASLQQSIAEDWHVQSPVIHRDSHAILVYLCFAISTQNLFYNDHRYYAHSSIDYLPLQPIPCLTTDTS